jgi:hypothetical protein
MSRSYGPLETGRSAPGRNVRLAALYGSIARGDDRAHSDVDILVDLVDGRSAGRTSWGLIFFCRFAKSSM